MLCVCPSCSRKIRVRVEQSRPGTIRCPACGAEIERPSRSDVSANPTKLKNRNNSTSRVARVWMIVIAGGSLAALLLVGLGIGLTLFVTGYFSGSTTNTNQQVLQEPGDAKSPVAAPGADSLPANPSPVPLADVKCCRADDPASPALPGSQDEFDAIFQEGSQALDDRELEAAIQKFDRALELKPGSAPASNARGVAYLRQFRPKPAYESFDEAIRLDPKVSKYFANRANVLRKLGEVRSCSSRYRSGHRTRTGGGGSLCRVHPFTRWKE